MSVQALAWVLDSVPADALTAVQRLVLLSIANHADKYGRNAWPSIATIGEEAGIRRRTTVKDALRYLREHGWVEVEIQCGGTADTRADRRPNRYSLPRMYGGPVGGLPPETYGGPVSALRGAGRRTNGGPVGGPLTVHEPSLTALAAEMQRQRHAEQIAAVDATVRSERTADHLREAQNRLRGMRPPEVSK